MVYKAINELPKQVKDNLPIHGCEIYLKAFNHAWEEYKDPKKRKASVSHEETAHKVAWAAVKKVYDKSASTGKWVKKTSKR